MKITVIPTLDYPLTLHSADYAELVENGTRSSIVVNKENTDCRLIDGVRRELSLDEAVRVSARTTETLLALGMDEEQDAVEQAAWSEKHPHAEPTFKDKNRLPEGLDPLDIFKNMIADKRDTVVRNLPDKYEITQDLEDEGEFKSDLPAKKTKGKKHTKRQDMQEKQGVLPPKDIYTSVVGLKLAAILNEYDKQVIQDAAQLRTYITNKLLEISSCGTPKDELRALELLGKISDIGLFVEKSEVSIVNATPAALEHAIKDKINRILGQHNVQIDDAEYTEVNINEEELEELEELEGLVEEESENDEDE